MSATTTEKRPGDAPEGEQPAKRAKTDGAAIAPLLATLRDGIPLNPLPEHPGIDPSVPHAPKRVPKLSKAQTKLALHNALRYFPAELHATLAPEFAQELADYGHIYMHRFRPTHYPMKAHPISAYPAECRQAAAIMLMIQNNLDPAVAQFPHELITYGGNGTVLSNWAQYHLLMHYLSTMTEEQTLVMYSGHPMGLFPSRIEAPRVVITNGMVIPNYSSKEEYEQMSALGVSMYGQMTAGSYCYIGPQGIVHGTTLTVLNAGRKYLGSADLSGKVFVTSGLGGMSGAQAKAAVITGAVGVVAEIDPAAVTKRHAQGWVQTVTLTLDECMAAIKEARAAGKPASIAFQGNVVDLLERLCTEEERIVDLVSDQTSCHNPFNGGYYPAGMSFEEANVMMAENPDEFKTRVQDSLRRHVTAINTLCGQGAFFWDYGNSFMLEAGRADADIFADEAHTSFRYPSYVEDIMGDIFSLGFGPFRWVCTSGAHADLQTTDAIAERVTRELLEGASEKTRQQYEDNLLWIQEAEAHQLVVGSEARIFYSDWKGRSAVAVAFNEAVASGELQGPVVISRDHHDVSGTDSPWRETSNVRDGSMFTADMAVQNFVGDSFRGATWIALHNGGGTGWGEAINGGFGLVLDGSPEAGERAKCMLTWDVNNGVARRAWARNGNAQETIARAMAEEPLLKVTVAVHADDSVVDSAVDAAGGAGCVE